MKCEIAKDLLTLYAEQLCSAETAKALEAHLAECPECMAQLEHYRNALGEEKNAEAEENTSEHGAALKPMKKIRKKLRHRIVLAVILGCMLLTLLGGIGVLGYGEMTNKCLSFSVIADIIKLNQVTKALTEGNTDALADVLAIRVEDYYTVKKLTDFESMNAYKAALTAGMDEAYTRYFEGKDITVKFSDLEQIPFEDSIDMDAEPVSLVNLLTTGYTYDFYEGDTLLMSLYFAKVANDSYILYAYMVESDATAPHTASFAPSALPFDEVVMEMTLRYTPKNRYEAIMAGEMDGNYRFLGLLIRKATSGAEETEPFAEEIEGEMQALADSGWVLKDSLFDVEDYDMEKNCWIYKVWFQFENMETGESCIMEQKFRLHEQNLYIMDDHPAQILGTCESLTDETESRMLSLFW